MPEVVSLGVDLGGTKIEAAVLRRWNEGADERFEVLVRRRVPTGAEGGYEAVLEATLALIRGVAADIGRRPEALPTGLGMPGSITRREGLVKNSNTVCLNGRPFRQDLGNALGGRVEFENDANCFALAEARLGAGRAYRDGIVFGVILGTGVGGGIVVNGRVWGGLQGIAGEWGHHAVGPWRSADRASEAADGRELGLGLAERGPCYCGKTGCLELYASGPAVERDYLRRTGRHARLPEIAARRANDPDAARALDEMLEALGRGLATLIDILDPTAIVLGGGVSNLDFLYTEGVERVRRLVFNDELLTPIVRHELGDSAGVLGAALLAG
ncbi:MAG TPA: ROK family protein [Polyangiaceae bacterium]|nr:ROK family protein [Polyangiaceae bacterium]